MLVVQMQYEHDLFLQIITIIKMFLISILKKYELETQT